MQDARRARIDKLTHADVMMDIALRTESMTPARRAEILGKRTEVARELQQLEAQRVSA